jgi:hypothetical protein
MRLSERSFFKGRLHSGFVVKPLIVSLCWKARCIKCLWFDSAQRTPLGNCLDQRPLRKGQVSKTSDSHECKVEAESIRPISAMPAWKLLETLEDEQYGKESL